MRYYPVNLDIKGRKCLVVGGGAVGTRKVKTLLECGAMVTVVSPVISESLSRLLKDNEISVKKREYKSSDIDGLFLVIGASDDQDLNRRIHADADQKNMLCNIADRPEICNFILPSIVKQGDLVIGISTSGKSPAAAKYIRKELEKKFGPEYAIYLQLMGAVRKKLLADKHEPEAHKHLFEKLIFSGLIDMIREKREDDINRLLKETLGEGFEFKTLIGA